MSLDVVVAGELNPDLILTGLDGLPVLGIEQLASGFTLTMGSSSAIFAVGLARLGLRVGLTGKVGDDQFGRYCVDFLHREGIDTSRVIVDPQISTGVTISLSYPEDRLLVTYQGSMACFTAEDLDWNYLRQARHFHTSAYYLQDGLRPDLPEVYRRAKNLGLSTSLDTGWDPRDRWGREIEEVWRSVDVFLPNEREVMKLAGAGTVEEALDRVARDVPVVAVKLGARGSVARVGGKLYRQPGFRIQAVDTTGAGDSFNAGFIYAHLNGFDVPEALVWGNACGALAASRAGGTGGFRNLAEVRRFLESGEREGDKA
ncbi:MAG: sugar kinase [Bacillota bacterium]|nr:sugar kinase [Bacillota bacterium]